MGRGFAGQIGSRFKSDGRHGHAVFATYALHDMAKRLMKIGVLGSFGLGILLTTLGAAPYLPRLLVERYPAADWPAHGAFAQLGEANRPTEPDRDLHKPTDRLQEIFQAKGGKALLVHHDGKLKLELYGEGITQDQLLNSYSVIKSLVGLLTLKAVADQKIGTLDDALGTFVPEIQDAALHRLAIHKLLNMRSGVLFESAPIKSIVGPKDKDLRETMANPFGPMAQLHFSGLGDLLPKLKSDQTAQSVFNYQNINTSLLGMVLERAYGQPLHQILDQTIWTPSGAGPAHWRRHTTRESVTSYCCLYARPIDWLHVARFVAANGTPDQPLLPQDIWDTFMGTDLRDEALHKGVYRNQTRYNVLDRPGETLQGPFSYFAGRGGQTVYLMPKQDLIVIRFGDEQQLLHSTLYESWKSITPRF